ncbi:hypothetical protein [Staphylococcus aureus]|uniref:hypothetical protein n=1 Tax=Staphylococcus aureus TaxID=1280 RepID=UPI001C30D0B3|nr:hypothetical protein [Staphylococcus aureus]
MKTKISKFILITFVLFGGAIASAQMIKTKTPSRPKGQQDVLRLATDPIPTVRVAFIGLGMRGPGAVERMTHIPGVEIVALCDMLEKNTQSANEILTKAGLPKAQEFFGDENAWRKVTALPNVDSTNL